MGVWHCKRACLRTPRRVLGPIPARLLGGFGGPENFTAYTNYQDLIAHSAFRTRFYPKYYPGGVFSPDFQHWLSENRSCELARALTHGHPDRQRKSNSNDPTDARSFGGFRTAAE